MKKVIRYQTSDGVEHKNFESATKYADNRYGNALTSLAHELLRVQKYRLMVEFLENNLGRFVEVQRFKDDIPLKDDDDEDDE